MASPSDPAELDSAPTRLLEELRARLEAVEELSLSVRRRMTTGDFERIEDATARLETLAQEFKLLAEEYRRLADARGHSVDERARTAFEATTARLARSSALTGGLLARMVALSRGLGALSNRDPAGYLPSGQLPDGKPAGVRLRERA